jgi:hypothetical protein
MITQTPKSKYNCTQAELYAIANITLNSFQEYLAAFTAFKSIYTATYYADRVAELNAAIALPYFQQRDEPVEVARVALKNKAEESLVAWQALKSYIEGTFKDNLEKAYLESAGAELYRRAAGENWDVLKQMLAMASQFITDHGLEMTNADMMPIGFASDFETLRLDVDALYTDFKAKEQNFKQVTAAKINANNALYDNIITIMKDGKKIFRNDAALRDRFVFKKVKAIVTPPASSVKTFEGTVTALQPAEVVLTEVNLNAAQTRLSFYNTTALLNTTALIFYFAATANEPPAASGSNSFYLAAGESVTNLSPTQAGYSAAKPFLLVYNGSNQSGNYKVEARK